jgi:hypothetical protein
MIDENAHNDAQERTGEDWGGDHQPLLGSVEPQILGDLDP